MYQEPSGLILKTKPPGRKFKIHFEKPGFELWHGQPKRCIYCVVELEDGSYTVHLDSRYGLPVWVIGFKDCDTARLWVEHLHG